MERLRGQSYAADDFAETVADMVTIGVKLDKRTHTLMMVFYMLEQDVDVSALNAVYLPIPTSPHPCWDPIHSLKIALATLKRLPPALTSDPCPCEMKIALSASIKVVLQDFTGFSHSST